MRRRASRISRFAPLFACITLAGSLPAAAATWRVDRTDDEPAATTCDAAAPNDCSLRGAAIRANASAEPSTIELPAGRYPHHRDRPVHGSAGRGSVPPHRVVALALPHEGRSRSSAQARARRSWMASWARASCTSTSTGGSKSPA